MSGVYVSVECDVCVVCMSVWSVMCVSGVYVSVECDVCEWCVCQCGV